MRKIGHFRFDSEGRFLRLDFSNFILINIYLLHGGRRKEEMNCKLEAYNTLLNYLTKLAGFNVILTGNFNVSCLIVIC